MNKLIINLTTDKIASFELIKKVNSNKLIFQYTEIDSVNSIEQTYSINLKLPEYSNNFSINELINLIIDSNINYLLDSLIKQGNTEELKKAFIYESKLKAVFNSIAVQCHADLILYV